MAQKAPTSHKTNTVLVEMLRGRSTQSATLELAKRFKCDAWKAIPRPEAKNVLASYESKTRKVWKLKDFGGYIPLLAQTRTCQFMVDVGSRCSTAYIFVQSVKKGATSNTSEE